MSRHHYGRGHRRGSSVCQTSFTIDKLFKESNNKPSAARSAGTVGKWGITSFTTIRGSGFGSRYAANTKNVNKDVKCDYSFDAEEKVKTEAPKPKKFFKSRNAGATSATDESKAEPLSSPSGKSTNSRKGRDDAGASKRVSLPSPSPQSDGEHKPPIVLRIIKGTSCILAEGSDSTVSPPRQSPRGDKSPGSRGRRRSTQDAEASWSPKGRRRSVADEVPCSPRPKRARREVIKDPAMQNLISQLISDDEGDEGFASQSQAVPPSSDVAENSEDSLPLEFYRQNSSANKENELKSEVNDKQDTALLEEAQSLLESTVPVKVEEELILSDKEEFKMEEHPAQESGEESDSQDLEQDSGIRLTSKVESGGLKLVIKKAPEIHVETEQTDSKSTKAAPVKKKSIFKSRRQDEGSKRLALYKHNWNSAQAEAAPVAVPDTTHAFPEPGSTFTAAALTRVPVDPRPGSPAEDMSKVKCDKNDKGFYTVIRNVKKAHQIQESGEFQELNDDVEYILDALQEHNPIGTRCLSAISLAIKCSAPAFRMHVRAHGTVAKFFKALHDATRDPSLGLCTATVMFVLSQDRLNMDLDRDSLELMLGLLEMDASHTNALDDCGMSSAQLHKNKQKVKELCAEIQNKGLAKHLNLENITVGQLAMETLLSLTSRRAGEWFKEELRELGGLDHIVKTISDCSRHLDTYISQWTDPLLDRLRKIDRCLRVLENVMSQNEENQNYLLRYENGLLPATVISLYKVCNDEIALYPCTDPIDKVSTGYVLREALLSTLKVLVQLTQEYNKKLFSETLRNGRSRILDSSLHLLLQVPNYIPDEEKFEFIVLVLTLMINMIESNEENRVLFMESKAPPDPESILETKEQLPASAALIQLYYTHEKRALEEEAQTDAILDGKKEEGTEEAPGPAKCKGDEIEETIAKLLKKAGNHMEHTFIGAYIAIVLGYLIMDSKPREMLIRKHLPNGRFGQIIAVLDKFVAFMKMTAWAAGNSSQSSKATEKILSYYVQVEKSIKLEVEVKEEPTDLSVASYEDPLV